jgi:putative peptidoglycan lipid II flippase
MGHPPPPAAPPRGVNDPDRNGNDDSRFDDPQLDAPQYEATQFDDPGFDTRRMRARESAATTTVVRRSAVVAVGTALSRLTGFVRIAAIAYALGVTALAGTYSYANETPNIVYELLLGGVLTATLVPIFVRHFESHDDDAASAIFTVSILALLAVTVVGILIAPWIVDLYTLRVHGPNRAEQQELATHLLRLFMPQMLFYGIATLATALLNARRRFAAAAFAPALNNLVVIAVFLALPRIASGPLTVRNVLDDDALVLLMGLGTTAGIVVMALALFPALKHAHIHLRYLPAFRHRAVRTLIRVSGWTVGYVIANQIALFVVTVLGNGTPGGPFVYVSAYAFFQLPHGLLAVSLATTFAPELASAALRRDRGALREQLSRGLRLTALAIAPAVALYLGLARPIVVALLQRGAFSSADAADVADTLAAFAVGLLPFSLYLFSLRAFTSRLNTFTPFWVNCVENAVNIVLAFPLYAWLGIPGLALAFSLAYYVGAALSLFLLHRGLRGIDGRRVASTIARVVLAAAVVAAATWGVAHAIGWSTTAEALLAAVVGSVVGGTLYLVMLVLLKVDELRILTALLPRRARV